MGHFLAPLVERRGERFLLRNVDTGTIVATDVSGAFDSPSRRRGLLGRRDLPPATALVLAPCAGIHTCFMRFSIDVVFTRRDGSVVKVCRNIKPWRMAWAPGAFAVIEFPARANLDVGPGHRLTIEPAHHFASAPVCS
jgi:uncharacterized membrane protein (UPF0127 family)